MISEFENTVKQEMINHDREIMITNARLNKMEKSISDQKESFTATMSAIASEQSRMLKNSLEFVNVTKEMTSKIWNKLQSIDLTVSECRGMSSDRRKEIIAIEDDITKMQIEFSLNMQNMQKKIEESKSIFSNNLNKIDIMKKELLEEIEKNKPEKPKEVPGYLTPEFMSMQIDKFSESIHDLAKMVHKLNESLKYQEHRVDNIYNKLLL